MKAAGCGAIMYDGWTLSGVHNVGLYASYNRKIKGSIELKPTISLIACAPMGAISGSDDRMMRTQVMMRQHSMQMFMHSTSFKCFDTTI